MTLLWRGNVALTAGVGVFCGKVGDNVLHAHSADQISLCRSGTPLTVVAGEKQLVCDGVYIASAIPHSIVGDDVLSLYIDPASVISEQLSKTHRLSDIMPLPCELTLHLTSLFSGDMRIGDSLELFVKAYGASLKKWRNARLERVLAILYQDQHRQSATPVTDIAAQLSLSESRFSHWFKAQTGLPFKRYRQWLRLLHGIESLLHNHVISESAHNAQFSDQAHFSRVLKNTFGITPGELTRGIEGTSD